MFPCKMDNENWMVEKRDALTTHDSDRLTIGKEALLLVEF